MLVLLPFPSSFSCSYTVSTGLNIIMVQHLSHCKLFACSLTTWLVGDLTQELVDSPAPLPVRLPQRGSCGLGLERTGLVLRRTGWDGISTEHSKKQLVNRSNSKLQLRAHIARSQRSHVAVREVRDFR